MHVVLEDGFAKKTLTSQEAIGWIDEKAISPDSALKLFQKGQFASFLDQVHFDNSSSATATYWLAFSVANHSQQSDWYLELHDPHLGSATLYELEGDKAKQLGTSGYFLPFHQRMTQHKNHFFMFSVYPQQEKTFLVKLQAPRFAKFYISIVDSRQVLDYSLKEYWYLGIYYGALFILLVYNFVLWINTRQKAFFWYSFFVAACIFSAFREDGLGFQFLWPSFPLLNYYHFDLGTLLVLVSFSGFASTFLDVRSKAPTIFKAMVFLVLLYSVVHLTESYFTHAWEISSYLYPVPYVVVFLTAFSFAWKRDRPALYFLVGFSSFVLGVLCFMLRIRGWIPNNIYTIYTPNFSVLSEVAIMSYALASRYREQYAMLDEVRQHEMQLLKEKAELDQQLIQQLAEKDKLKESINQELEKKVVERTLELNTKNEELANAYQQLSYYKERLETDWQKLDKEKWELSKQVNERIFDNIKGKELSYEAFVKIFPNNETCLHYLAELKWAKGFVCKQCGHTKYMKGDLPHSRKCTRCTHRETATAGTLFHGVKIDLTKAFYITHTTMFGTGNTTLKELSERLELRTATCWNFKKKVEEAKGGTQAKSTWEEVLLLD